LNGLDLFSGIGGISLGLRDWVKTIAYCEIEPYLQRVLLSRMRSGDLEKGPIWDDIRTFDGSPFKGVVDIVHGGFPCQNISGMGDKTGIAGKQSGLYWEMYRIFEEVEPKFIFLENVEAIKSRGGAEVVLSLAELGYSLRWCTLSAQEIGAIHKRNRFFLLAYTDRLSSFQADSQTFPIKTERTARVGLAGHAGKVISRDDWKENSNELLRGNDGISHRVDRCRALGNAVVPDQAKWAFRKLVGI